MARGGQDYERDDPCAGPQGEELPAPEQLVAFGVGKLPEALREVVASHIEDCATCLDMLGTLDDHADPVIVAVRKPLPRKLFFGGSEAPPAPPAIPNYELVHRIGHGAFGEVWLGRNQHTGQYYAVKVLRRSGAIELEGIRAYKQRAQGHANLLPIEHVGKTGAFLGVFAYPREKV